MTVRSGGMSFADQRMMDRTQTNLGNGTGVRVWIIINQTIIGAVFELDMFI